MGADRNDRNDVTNGELFRILEEHGKTLAEIREDVKRQNGRVAIVERDVAVLQDRDLRDDTARGSALIAFLTGLGSLVIHYFRR